MEDTELLMETARKRGRMTSTIELSKGMDCSQQTISRRLGQLEKNGFIRRTVTPRGQRLELTQKGRDALKRQYSLLKEIFEGSRKMEIRGTVESGLKEGRYYMSLPYYRRQIRQKLGFEPFPGTLNIRAGTDALTLNEPVKIDGFSGKDRSYGAINCYKAKIGKLKGAIIFPERAHHTGVIEMIAPVELRKKLGLKDGDKVRIEVL